MRQTEDNEAQLAGLMTEHLEEDSQFSMHGMCELNNYCNVVVTTVSGKTFEMRMQTDRDVLDIKCRLQEELGVSQFAQELMLGTDQLANKRSLASLIDGLDHCTVPTLCLLVVCNRELSDLVTLGLGDLLSSDQVKDV